MLKLKLIVLFFISLLVMPLGYAMELAPLRWSHLPVGVNFAGVAYAYTEADVLIDPVVRLENVEMELQTLVGKYIRTFELFDKSARIDIKTAYQKGTWTGLLNGTPAIAHREGFNDAKLRLAINLYGAPPLEGKEFAFYRANADIETIVGVALVASLPTGEYMDDKLINLGENRFSFSPQFGVTHKRGKWTMELTGQVALYTENDDFYNGKTIDQEPLYFVHGHLIHTFKPGVWTGLSLGYDYGGESTIDGIDNDDRRQNIGWALRFTYPIDRYALSVAYIGTRTQEEFGLNTNTLTTSLAFHW